MSADVVSGESVRQAVETVEALASDARLDRFEGALDHFNIFDAVGLRWKETDHSTCLAFLLNPAGTHALRDAVLRTLLGLVAASLAAMVATDSVAQGRDPVEPVPDDMTAAAVQTEVYHVDGDGFPGRIDILVLDEANKLALIVENKTGTHEHDDQLRRYYNAVRHRHAKPWRIIALYLSLSGEEPSCSKWIGVSYARIRDTLVAVANAHGAEADPGVQVLLDHYADLIGRKIVGDDDIDRLSRRLYTEHRAAFDQVIRRVELRSRQIRGVIEGLVREEKARARVEGRAPSFELDESWSDPITGGLFLRVAYIPWDGLLWDKQPERRNGNGKWTTSRRLLLYTFGVYRDHLDVNLMVGPGDEQERRRLLGMEGHAPLQQSETYQSRIGPFSVLYKDIILDAERWAAGSDADIDTTIRAWWKTFTTRTAPAIDALARSHSAGPCAW